MTEPRRDPQDVPMIYRRNPRVVATACLGCGHSLIVCHATVEYEGRRCCGECAHD